MIGTKIIQRTHAFLPNLRTCRLQGSRTDKHNRRAVRACWQGYDSSPTAKGSLRFDSMSFVSSSLGDRSPAFRAPQLGDSSNMLSRFPQFQESLAICGLRLSDRPVLQPTAKKPIDLHRSLNSSSYFSATACVFRTHAAVSTALIPHSFPVVR